MADKRNNQNPDRISVLDGEGRNEAGSIAVEPDESVEDWTTITAWENEGESVYLVLDRTELTQLYNAIGRRLEALGGPAA